MKSILKRLIIATMGLTSLAWSNGTESKIKDAIDNAASALKSGVEKCGDKMEDMQEYFRNYDWKGLFQIKTTSGATTISEVKLNGHMRAVVVKPGDKIEGKLKYVFDKDQCKDLKYHRILIGLKGEGPQTTIGEGIGIIADKESKETFALKAPYQPGLYQIRFRSVENLREGDAMKKWYDAEGNEPSAKTTIGFIYVKG